jgi:hypothetical protein
MSSIHDRRGEFSRSPGVGGLSALISQFFCFTRSRLFRGFSSLISAHSHRTNVFIFSRLLLRPSMLSAFEF